jgi:hypothetical protein
MPSIGIGISIDQRQRLSVRARNQSAAARTIAFWGDANVLTLATENGFAVDGSSYCTSWAPEKGATITPTNANIAEVVTISGHRFLVFDGAFGAYTAPYVGARSVVAVGSYTGPLPASGTRAIVSNAVSPLIQIQTGTSVMVLSTNYIDGAAVSTVTAGVHAFAQTTAVANGADTYVGGAADRPWIGNVGLLLALSITATAQQMADYYAQIIKPLYREFLP